MWKGSRIWNIIYACKVDGEIAALFAGLRQKHQQDLEKLTLTTQPFKTLKLFTLAVVQYVKRVISYLLVKGGYLMLLSVVTSAVGILLVTLDGPHEKVNYSFRIITVFLTYHDLPPSCFVCILSFTF